MAAGLGDPQRQSIPGQFSGGGMMGSQMGGDPY